MLVLCLRYTWIVACGGLAAFFMAWGIGANDVANRCDIDGSAAHLPSYAR